MTNHPNRGRSGITFEVVKIAAFDSAAMNTEYAFISRHKTRDAAERKISNLAGAEQTARWPHHPEMVDVISDEYQIREITK